MASTNISWARYTLNWWIGCTRVSPACDRCYAADLAKRKWHDVTWGEPGTKAVHRPTAESTRRAVFAWDRKAKRDGDRPTVFCGSLMDWADTDVPIEWCHELCAAAEACPNLDFMFLTKRPQNIMKRVPAHWRECFPPNVWMGTTTENQEEAERRIPHLLKTPAIIHFLSVEPMLGDVDPFAVALNLCQIHSAARIDQVIVGGESGRGFRTLSMAAVDRLWQGCIDNGALFHFKQDSSLKPGCKGRARDALWRCKQMPSPDRAAWPWKAQPDAIKPAADRGAADPQGTLL